MELLDYIKLSLISRSSKLSILNFLCKQIHVVVWNYFSDSWDQDKEETIAPPLFVKLWWYELLMHTAVSPPDIDTLPTPSGKTFMHEW